MDKSALASGLEAAKVIVPVAVVGGVGTVVYIKRNDIKTWWTGMVTKVKDGLAKLNPFKKAGDALAKVKTDTDASLKKADENLKKVGAAMNQETAAFLKDPGKYTETAISNTVKGVTGFGEGIVKGLKLDVASQQANKLMSDLGKQAQSGLAQMNKQAQPFLNQANTAIANFAKPMNQGLATLGKQANDAWTNLWKAGKK
jgi:ElaB/YqjD/DUF883 family membrane-anchored ribosome-binding protein